jgi:GNAT superfamily N-acetyltransferase
MGRIRQCSEADRAELLTIINAAAEAYRGIIPADRWHEPYMPAEELESEIAAGVEFCGYEMDGTLVGIMGLQRLRDVDLIRHAYVLPSVQRQGVGAQLLEHLLNGNQRQILVGTWAAATWAIQFYERHGFRLVSPMLTAALLSAHWSIPARQAETSVVLANPPVE